MLKVLRCREAGLQNPYQSICNFRSRRSAALQISKVVEFSPPGTSSLFSLEIDPTESKYILCGGSQTWMGVYSCSSSIGTPSVSYSKVFVIDSKKRGNHTQSILACKWYPRDNGLFLSGSMDCTMKIWDTNRVKVVDTVCLKHSVLCLDISKAAGASTLVAVGLETPSVRLLDLRTGASTHSLRNGHLSSILSVQWSPQNPHLLVSTGSDRRVALWDIRRARSCLAQLDHSNRPPCSKLKEGVTAHDGAVTSANFSEDGSRLLTYGADHKMRLWDLHSRKNLCVNYGYVENYCRKSLGLAVSMECTKQLVYVPSDCNIEVFEMESGLKVKTLRGHYKQVNCCTFDPVRCDLYSAGNDRSILVWSADTHDEFVDSRKSQPDVKDIEQLAAEDAWSDDD